MGLRSHRDSRRRAGAVLLALGLLAAAGCGLDEYERLMDAERARFEHHDAENEALGFPVQTPPSYRWKDPKSPPKLAQVKLFLRPLRTSPPQPPWGTVPVEGEEPAQAEGVELYRYAGPPGYNLYLAADTGTMPSQDFQRTVLAALQGYVERLHKRRLLVPNPIVTAKVVKESPKTRLDALPPVWFKALTLNEAGGPEDASHFAIYFHQSEGKQVAVIYQVPLAKATDQTVMRGIDFSLKTLGIGSAAARNEQIYTRRQRLVPPRPPPPLPVPK
ncbi:MAG: hypothetical protein IT429_16440 [Gemmataceae bacterium]|nr:hypothetical protein [Gemmataceae bacterium]